MNEKATNPGGWQNQRTAERRAVRVPGRIVWRDARGTPRIASVVTRNISEHGVLAGCLQGTPIPLYRLVSVHLDPVTRERPDVPAALRRPNMLAAVFRVGPYSPVTGAPEHYALRLLVKPERKPRVAIEPRMHQPRAVGDTCRQLTA